MFLSMNFIVGMIIYVVVFAVVLKLLSTYRFANAPGPLRSVVVYFFTVIFIFGFYVVYGLTYDPLDLRECFSSTRPAEWNKKNCIERHIHYLTSVSDCDKIETKQQEAGHIIVLREQCMELYKNDRLPLYKI